MSVICVTSAMKCRQIWGNQVVLVPYAIEHVDKYHTWMKDESLLYLTGSEPLSLAEEYEMLNKWNRDGDKCTFIVCDKLLYEQSGDQVSAMIGDVNLYFGSNDHDVKYGEIEVMIAESGHRGQGKGKEVVMMMIKFAIEIIGTTCFVAKIKQDNLSSQKMFQKLGFKEKSRSEVFGEIEYVLEVEKTLIETLEKQISTFKYVLLSI